MDGRLPRITGFVIDGIPLCPRHAQNLVGHAALYEPQSPEYRIGRDSSAVYQAPCRCVYCSVEALEKEARRKAA